MDFTKTPPRSPFEELEGYPWLPRLIDKARATAVGTQGDFHPYPTPGDRRFCWYFGVSAPEIGRMVQRGASDEEIARYVKTTSKRSPAEVAAYRRDMYRPTRNPVLSLLFRVLIARVKKRLQAETPQADLSGLDTLEKALAFEDGYPVPTRAEA